MRAPYLIKEVKEKKSTRDGFGLGIIEAGRKNKDVVVLSADLKESTRAEWFEKEFKDRYVELGVAEQNMVTVASGMAAEGKIPFVTSYAAFSPGRNYEQIRTTIALNNRKVVVCGMHAGVSVGPDGATHQMLEDIGMMRMLPNMTVINPCDAEEGRKATIAVAEHSTPSYLRFGRANTPVFTTPETPFEIGKALPLFEQENAEIIIVSTGALSYEALLAGEELSKEGLRVSVLHYGTIKPFDGEALVNRARKARAVFTLEEHQIAGGFGSVVCEYLSEHHPIPVIRMGIKDTFGQSGEPQELLHYYGLTASQIKDTIQTFYKHLHASR